MAIQILREQGYARHAVHIWSAARKAKRTHIKFQFRRSPFWMVGDWMGRPLLYCSSAL